MMQTQAAIDPSLAALLQTAQMVTPDQTPTVAAQVAQAAQQKMQPQGITQGMPQARQDFQAAMPSMMRNMQQQQMQQMVQQAMQPKPAGIEGLQSNIRMAEGGVVGYSGEGPSFVAPQKRPDETFEEFRQRTITEQEAVQQKRRDAARAKAEEERVAEMTRRGMAPRSPFSQTPPAPTPQAPIPEGSDRRLDIPAGGIVSPGMAQAPQAPAPRPPAPPPPAPAQAAPTGVATLAQPKMDLSRYEKAGAEDRAAIEKIIAAQEANAREKAGYMAGRPKFEQEGIAALTKANQAREELLAKERADDAYNRQQALLDQIGRRNTNAYSQEQGRQRQRDLAAAEAQRLYEQAVIKQREAEFLQGAGRFEEAKKALDDKEKILSAMQARINQSRQTEAGIAERQFTGDVQMFEGAQNREQNERLERIRKATANQPGEAERIFNEYTRRKAIDPKDAEAYLTTIDRIKGSGRGISERQDVNELKALITSLKDQADPLKNFDKSSREQASVLLKQAQDKLAQMSGLGGGGTGSQAPMYAKNPKTNERIMSTDGGQTWKPAQ
jgi:hypothetical protein